MYFKHCIHSSDSPFQVEHKIRELVPYSEPMRKQPSFPISAQTLQTLFSF